MMYQMLKIFNCIRWCTEYCYKKVISKSNDINSSNSWPSHCFWQLYVVEAAGQVLTQHLFMILCNLQLSLLHMLSRLKWLQGFLQVLRTWGVSLKFDRRRGRGLESIHWGSMGGLKRCSRNLGKILEKYM